MPKIVKFGAGGEGPRMNANKKEKEAAEEAEPAWGCASAIDAVSEKMVFYLDEEFEPDWDYFDWNQGERYRRALPNNPTKQIQKLAYVFHWVNDQCLVFCRDHDELGNKINKFKRQALQVLALYTKPNFRPTKSPKERPPEFFRPDSISVPDGSNTDGSVPDPFLDWTPSTTDFPPANVTAAPGQTLSSSAISSTTPITKTTTTTTTISTKVTTTTTKIPCVGRACAKRGGTELVKNPLSRSSERIRKFFLSWG
ncbi:unnamed protein product [Oikopleura dioica]|uniref:Uncharacterized protein n=1 Tax=Oikopleura dioica TaxID=34765 RepID=E4XIV1_OIKDI|nr:unnamed protein product [Oikopleura dioica]